MNNKDFWQDVLRSGALLGVVMSFSLIVEQYIMVCSPLSLAMGSFIYFVEWCSVAVIFVAALYRLTRRRAKESDPQVGYGYAQALSYILLISALTGVVVGVVHMLFISVIGYDGYVEGMLHRIDEMRSMMLASGGGSYNALFEQMVSGLRSAEQPTIIDYVILSANNYILCGGVVGLIIAGFVRREPTIRREE
ncbi:MAG: DUF4199 domain-containing protein [Alistipes sp.]|nr:DUF4199 domain-containing protein [Alistipes sp.]